MSHVKDLKVSIEGEWLVKTSDIFHGPFSRDQIKELLVNGDTSDDIEYFPNLRRSFKKNDHRAIFHFFPELGEMKSTQEMTKTLFITQTHSLTGPWYKNHWFFFWNRFSYISLHFCHQTSSSSTKLD